VRRAELVVAVALLVSGLLTIAVVIPRYVAGAPLSGGLSPAFMPYVAAGLATLAALGMLIESLRAREASLATRLNLRFLFASAAVLGASFALLTWVGYVIGGAVLVAGILALARVKLLPLAIAAVVAPVALWLLFVALLATPLP
jgi:hypothetical protein